MHLKYSEIKSAQSFLQYFEIAKQKSNFCFLHSELSAEKTPLCSCSHFFLTCPKASPPPAYIWKMKSYIISLIYCSFITYRVRIWAFFFFFFFSFSLRSDCSKAAQVSLPCLGFYKSFTTVYKTKSGVYKSRPCLIIKLFPCLSNISGSYLSTQLLVVQLYRIS